MTASTMITGAAQRDAFGNSGRHSVSIPNVPTLSSTPTSSVEVPAGACCAASGSQVCTGNIGALMANARKNAQEHELLGGRVQRDAREVLREEALRSARLPAGTGR